MRMVNRIELLAPAGDFDSLLAAVENGADAVYLGGKLFNARQFAGNFDSQKLGEALDYAHIRGVNIYLAMNTLISDSEMKAAAESAGEAWLAGIDGIIVQDLGFAGIIKKMLPDLPLHASTQMTVHNLDGAKVLERLGFKRVVTARELSLDEIREITAGTSLEVEVFIHGALCISYSGQCLMSSIIGGRSGNRGKCAQPCRLPYTLLEGESGTSDKMGKNQRYLLSPRDLCTLPQLTEIAASGVKSLKIEGRMKSAEYVATVVRIYRKYLDGAAGSNDLLPCIAPRNDAICENKTERQDLSQPNSNPSQDTAALAPDAADLHQLAQVFNRGGFTGGYIGGIAGQDLMCFEKPKNWGTFLGRVMSYNPSEGIVRVKLDGNLAIGDGIEIWNDENQSPGTIVTLIRINGRNVKEAFKADVVEIGNIKGKIHIGARVYKTSDKRLLDAARESFEGRPRKRVGLKGEVILKKGMPLILKVYDADGYEASAEGSVLPEKALNRPLTRERLAEQLGKTGATPFEIRDLEILLEEGLSLPVSEINDIRRKALDELQQKRMKKYSRDIADIRAVSALPDIQQRLSFDFWKQGSPFFRSQQNCHCVSNDMIARESSMADLRKQQISSSRAAPRIALYFYEWNSGMDYASLNADRLYIPFKALLKPENNDRFSAIREKGIEVFIWTPAIIRGNYLKLIKEKMKDSYSRRSTENITSHFSENVGCIGEQQMQAFATSPGRNGTHFQKPIWEVIFSSVLNIDGILAGSPAVVKLLENMISATDCYIEAKGDNNPVPLSTCQAGNRNDMRLVGDQFFNIFNTDAALMYKSIGFDSITLSTELNLGQICEISNKADMELESVVYGRLPLMTSEYCPVGSVKGGFSSDSKCSGCCSKGQFRLKDRLGIDFPVICDKIDCRSTILNSNVLFVPEAVKKLADAGVSTFRLYIMNECIDRIKELVNLYRMLACKADAEKYAGLVKRIKSEGFTKGHFYKGV